MPDIPKPPRGEKYDAAANDWMAGQMEAEIEKEKTKDIKPVVKAPKPKAYARGGGIEIKGKTKGRFV